MRDQEVIDFGMEKYLTELDSDLTFVDVGIVARDGAKKLPPKENGKMSDITLAELATIHEFGTAMIPSRPFMRQTFDEQFSKLSKAADRLDRESLSGKMTRRAALQELGQMHRQEIQKNIGTKGKFVANRPATIKKKGSDNELVDTGHLRQSIDYEVG